MRLLQILVALAIYTSCNAQTEQISAPTQENSATTSSVITSEKVTNQHEISESKVRKPRAKKENTTSKVPEIKEEESELPDLRDKK